jgi:hypothetical protein
MASSARIRLTSVTRRSLYSLFVLTCVLTPDIQAAFKLTLFDSIIGPDGQIRLKSSAPTFSGTDFVCQKTCV